MRVNCKSGNIMSKLIKRFFGRQSFVAGALIISAGGFISKILGALYRIPLTNILGAREWGYTRWCIPCIAYF